MMLGSFRCLLVSLLIKSSLAKWYARVCPTGEIESAMRDQDGNIVFVQVPNNATGGATDGPTDGPTDGAIDEDLVSGNNDTNRRRLRNSDFTTAIQIHGKRYLQEQNSSEIFHVRSCACGGVDLLLCPAEADFCGIPFSEDSPIACYSVNAKEVVARNAWPLILLWYFGLLIICCCTNHGHMTKDYCWSCLTTHRNEAFMNRLLSEDSDSMSPGDQWSWWTWQRYRFEQRLLAQAQWALRNQEAQRQQHRIERGFPATEWEMKTTRFKLDTDIEESRVQQKEQADDDSYNQPNCSICFVPLENGDRIGALDCQHNFHSDCLKAWLSRRNACPLCSQPVARRRPQPNEEDHLNEIPSTITPHRRFPWQPTQPEI
jgi:hypothetical protein